VALLVEVIVDRCVDGGKLLLGLQVPSPLRIASVVPDSPLPDLGREHWTEPVPPEPYGLMADVYAALEQEILYLPK
jgi:hypothetical protein